MRTRELTLIAILVSILVVAQFTFSIVVGINLVFPLLIIYTYNFGLKKTLIIMFTFVLVRLLSGLPITIVFLWSWTFFILVFLAHFVNKMTSGNEYMAAVYTFFYFLLFGLLCGIQEHILTEVPVLIYWARGIPTDLLGAVAGFVTTLVLLKPISNVIHHFNESTAMTETIN